LAAWRCVQEGVGVLVEPSKMQGRKLEAIAPGAILLEKRLKERGRGAFGKRLVDGEGFALIRVSRRKRIKIVTRDA